MRGPMPSAGITLQVEIGEPIIVGPIAIPQQQGQSSQQTGRQQQQQQQRQQSSTQQSSANSASVPAAQRQQVNRIQQLIDSQLRMLLQTRNQHMRTMRTLVSSVFRDFGRDDGGQWVAMVPERGYIPIDYEAIAGTQLTEEELARDPVPFADNSPQFVASPDSAYAPIPGLSRIQDPGYNGSSSSHRIAELPSRALANELVYNLRDRVLPEIRRLPGLQSFNFSSVRPEYLSQSTSDPVGAAGTGISALGDAFVEIGRALRTVGGQWQSADTVSAETAYSPDHMLSLVQAVSNAALAASVATPFLRSTPVQLAQSRTVSWEDTSDREDESNDGSSRRTQYIIANNLQRNYRRLAQSMLMLNNPRTPEDRPPQTGTRLSPVESALHSLHTNFSGLDDAFGRSSASGASAGAGGNAASVIYGDSLMRRWQRQWQRRLGQQRRSSARQQQQSQRQQQASQNNSSSSENTGSGGSRDNTNTASASASTSPGTINNNSSNSSNNASLNNFVSNLEERISQILQGHSAPFSGDHPVEIEVEAISMPSVGFHILNSAGSSNQPNATESAETQIQDRDQQQQADILSNSDATDISSADMHRSGSPENVAFGFIDRAGAVGSQTARSDRSNFSTTTEYSTNNGPSTRVPRILNFGANGFGSQLPGFGLISNPFPLASVFLGTESSSSSTTRRTSISSNPSRPTATDEANSNSDANANANANANAVGADAATTTDAALTMDQSLENQQQVGATRPRSVSFLNVSHGDDYEAGAACENSSYTRGSRGSSKRHKTRSGESSGNEDDDSDDNEYGDGDVDVGSKSNSSSSRGI
ncbi:hypothetical protein FB639_002401 [Coemansia asiatica]|nr:hypothetical protein FB639_002401 [Coemansia asiatica]